MKYFVVLALLSLGLGACSSSKKKAEDGAAKSTESATKKSSKKMKSSKPMAKAPEGAVSCKYENFTRVLEVVPSDSGSVVRYTKDGEASEIANCAAGSDHCQTVVNKVRSNLESAGFTCS